MLATRVFWRHVMSEESLMHLFSTTGSILSVGEAPFDSFSLNKKIMFKERKAIMKSSSVTSFDKEGQFHSELFGTYQYR